MQPVEWVMIFFAALAPLGFSLYLYSLLQHIKYLEHGRARSEMFTEALVNDKTEIKAALRKEQLERRKLHTLNENFVRIVRLGLKQRQIDAPIDEWYSECQRELALRYAEDHE